jgi:cystathionine beta-lyase
MNEKRTPNVSPETIVTHSGRRPFENRGYVNTPVYRGSTILFPTLDALESTEPRFDYGRTGNPSSAAVEETVSQLEGASGTVLAPSGLSAISLALMTVLGSGDEVLITDSAYQPTRRVSDGVLTPMGINVT